MSSPFAPFANAVLNFDLPTGEEYYNEVGNRVVQTTPVQLLVMLSPVRDAATVNQYVGDDQTSELMSGYLVSPLSMPENLTPPIEGTAEITTAIGGARHTLPDGTSGRMAGVNKTGTFKLLPLTQSPYLVGLKIEFLTKVFGTFSYG